MPTDLPLPGKTKKAELLTNEQKMVLKIMNVELTEEQKNTLFLMSSWPGQPIDPVELAQLRKGTVDSPASNSVGQAVKQPRTRRK